MGFPFLRCQDRYDPARHVPGQALACVAFAHHGHETISRFPHVDVGLISASSSIAAPPTVASTAMISNRLRRNTGGSNDRSCGGEPSVKVIGVIIPFCLAARRVSTRDTACGSFGAIAATTIPERHC